MIDYLLRCMNRHSRGRQFIELNKYDNLLLVSLQLAPSTTISQVVQYIDQQYLPSSDIYFAYQLLHSWTHPQQPFHEIVMVYCQDHFPILRMFNRVPKCELLRVQETTVMMLYQRLASLHFLVDKELIFQRLKVKERNAIIESHNPLTRMICIEKNVLCLSNIESEELFMTQMKVYIRQSQKRQRVRKQQPGNCQHQFAIQKYLYGEYRNSIQIHVPYGHREFFVYAMGERTRYQAEAMKDFIEEEKMEGEGEQLAYLMLSMHIQEDCNKQEQGEEHTNEDSD